MSQSSNKYLNIIKKIIIVLIIDWVNLSTRKGKEEVGLICFCVFRLDLWESLDFYIEEWRMEKIKPIVTCMLLWDWKRSAQNQSSEMLTRNSQWLEFNSIFLLIFFSINDDLLSLFLFLKKSIFSLMGSCKILRIWFWNILLCGVLLYEEHNMCPFSYVCVCYIQGCVCVVRKSDFCLMG